MKTVSPNRDVGSNPTSGVYRGVAKWSKAPDFDSGIAGSNPAVSAHGSVTKPGKVRGCRGSGTRGPQVQVLPDLSCTCSQEV